MLLEDAKQLCYLDFANTSDFVQFAL
jgi:hypothetical protein